MKKTDDTRHDLANARRGAVLDTGGKTRVTMYVDDDVLAHYRALATANGRGYQTEINAALRRSMAPASPPKRIGSGAASGQDIDLRDAVMSLAKRMDSMERVVSARAVAARAPTTGSKVSKRR